MTSNASAPGALVPVFQPDQEKHRRRIATWATEVNKGNIQNTGLVTLVSGTAQTVVVDTRAGINSWIGLMPLTADALSAEPTVYVSSQGKGTFTLAHSSTASGDRTFRYAFLGI